MRACSRLLIVYALVTFFFARIATADEPAFYAQCHALLPIADDFAHDCLQQARPFSRTFYPGGGSRGEIESFSAYFRPLSAPSHFVLGCVLDFRHQIAFAGLYYTPRLLDMNGFSNYKIVFIDFQDNVGLDVDGVQTTFVAVRQFVTDVIPPRYNGRPKDCEEAGIEDIKGVKATSYYHIRALGHDEFEFCEGDFCKVSSYAILLGKHSVPVVYADWFPAPWVLFIDGEGSLIIEANEFAEACKSWRRNLTSVYDLITEVCPNPEVR
ncbi:MAG TPA: hypothetical protein VME45_20865 [Stellaceae bacterium]|nr:hypothetical protein [Stellaceae bacterium]